MSIQLLKNAIRNHAATAADVPATTKQGQISGYDPDNCTVKVQFLPDETETGWIPLGSPWVGDGWGMCCAPSVGDQITVEFQDGAQNAPLAMLRMYDATNQALGTPSGEFWLVHKSGAFIKLQNNGALTLLAPNGSSIELDGQGNILSTGTLTHTGNATITENLTVDQALQANSAQITNKLAAGQLSAANGATGTFTAQSGQTITVTNGIITSI